MNEQTPQSSETPAGAASVLSAGLGIERFAPGVVVNGRVLTPAGWMWVIGFALAGCEWAIEEASKPDFRECVADWMRERKRIEAEREIAALEKRIADIRVRLMPNAGIQPSERSEDRLE